MNAGFMYAHRWYLPMIGKSITVHHMVSSFVCFVVSSLMIRSQYPVNPIFNSSG